MCKNYQSSGHMTLCLQSAVRRRDGLQLDKEKAGEEREKKKKVHDEVRNIHS